MLLVGRWATLSVRAGRRPHRRAPAALDTDHPAALAPLCCRGWSLAPPPRSPPSRPSPTLWPPVRWPRSSRHRSCRSLPARSPRTPATQSRPARPISCSPWGGTGAVPDAAVADAAVARLDGPHAPEVVPEPAAGAELADLAFAVTADMPLTASGFGVRFGGREVPGTTTLDGATARWEAGAIPADIPRDVPLPVEVTGIVVAAEHARHVTLAYTHTATIEDLPGPNGFVIAGGGSDVAGTGSLVRFTIEVEPGVGWEPQEFAAIAEPWLLDTAHGWTARGQWALQRVDDAAQANIRVVLASPAHR